MKTTRMSSRPEVMTYKHWVFGLYLSDKLIYVGVTADPSRRLGDIAKEQHFDEMRLIKGFSSRDRANQYKNSAIKLFDGLRNIASSDPMPVGFSQNIPRVLSHERKYFNSRTAPKFDFDLLSNPTINKRIRWESQTSNG